MRIVYNMIFIIISISKNLVGGGFPYFIHNDEEHWNWCKHMQIYGTIY